MMQTRAQKDLKMAYDLVSEVQTKHPEPKNETKSIYSQLCKQFPVMVLQSGLCQTLAFHADKAKKGDARAKAHEYILQHAARVMSKADPLQEAQKASALEYMHHTRRILEAWVFFKRFAVSALEITREEK
jgi:CRISPR-associated protein Cmr5